MGAVSTVLDALAKADAKKPGRADSSLSPAGGPPPPPRSRFWRILGLLVLLVSGFVVGLFSDDEDDVVPAEVAVSSPAPNAGSAEVPIKPASADASRPVADSRVARVPVAPVPPGDSSRPRPKAGAAGLAPPPSADGQAEVEEKTPTGKPRDSAQAEERSRWRESRMAARDQAREARARVAKGEISREDYREERRALRAQARLEREDRQQDRREAQIARRLDLQERRAAQAAARTGRIGTTGSSIGSTERTGAAGARDPFLPEERGSADAVAASEQGNPQTASAAAGQPLRGAGVAETTEGGGAAPAVPSTVPVEMPLVAAAPAMPPEGHGLELRRWVPAGAPSVRIQILQWSRDDSRRFAFISVDGGRATRVAEGAVVGPLSIKTIYREMIEIEFGEKSFLLRAN